MLIRGALSRSNWLGAISALHSTWIAGVSPSQLHACWTLASHILYIVKEKEDIVEIQKKWEKSLETINYPPPFRSMSCAVSCWLSICSTCSKTKNISLSAMFTRSAENAGNKLNCTENWVKVNVTSKFNVIAVHNICTEASFCWISSYPVGAGSMSLAHHNVCANKTFWCKWIRLYSVCFWN